MTNEQKREVFLSALAKHDRPTITRLEIMKIVETLNIPRPTWFMYDKKNKAGRGEYYIPAMAISSTSSPELAPASVVELPTTRKSKPTVKTVKTVNTVNTDDTMIPSKYENFVPFGNFDDLKQIIQSKQFYPIFITGHSGNGKTFSVEQACAQLKRKFICVSMTPETDEGDLLGNFVLVDNTMVWKDGPVTVAAKEGAILCLDEIDYGASNLTTLQRVLEGKPFLLKKKNEMVMPAEGFNVIATANTKGKGSEDGRYMFTNVLNEAFLERFPIMFEQEWAPKNSEKRIIHKELKSVGMDDETFASLLIDWAGIIRKTFADGGCQDVISTRRLVHIVKAYAIFKDRIKAIQYCLNRFDKETTTSFLDLYTKLDVTVAPVANTVAPETPTAEPAKDVNAPTPAGTIPSGQTTYTPTTVTVNTNGTGITGINYKTYSYDANFYDQSLVSASDSNKQAYLDAVKKMLENGDTEGMNVIMGEGSKLKS